MMSEEWVSAGKAVRFSETDASGRVHFTQVLRYVEDAEHEYLAQQGVCVWSKAGHGWPRVQVSCAYQRALSFGDQYCVRFSEVNPGRSSLEWVFQVLCEGQVCAEGTMVTVQVNQAGEPIPIANTL